MLHHFFVVGIFGVFFIVFGHFEIIFGIYSKVREGKFSSFWSFEPRFRLWNFGRMTDNRLMDNLSMQWPFLQLKY